MNGIIILFNIEQKNCIKNKKLCSDSELIDRYDARRYKIDGDTLEFHTILKIDSSICDEVRIDLF